MPTYSKETALFDTGKIGDDINNAAGQVNKYITQIGDTGIKVHPYDSTNEQVDTDNYTKIDANGMEVYQDIDGTSTKVASFGSGGSQIGRTGAAHSVIDADGQRFYASDGTTQLANIGYGEYDSSNYPYYTFGTRLTATNIWDSATTYNIGDLVLYRNSSEKPYDTYVCVQANSGHAPTNVTTYWKLYIYPYSFAEGEEVVAAGWASHAEGENTISSGTLSHAEGLESKAIGYYSHAEGRESKAIGESSHAEGYFSEANGARSHAEGFYSKANGDYSHAQNASTIASKNHQTAIGKYNIEDTEETTSLQKAFIIGNGESSTSRSDAFTVDWSGNVVAAGGLTLNGTEEVVDYVIEDGIDGSWQYRKWNKGRIEAWYVGNVTMSSTTSTTSGVYYRTATLSVPSGIFNTAPRVIVGSAADDNTIISVKGYAESTTSIKIRDYRTNQNSSTQSRPIRVYAWNGESV